MQPFVLPWKYFLVILNLKPGPLYLVSNGGPTDRQGVLKSCPGQTFLGVAKGISNTHYCRFVLSQVCDKPGNQIICILESWKEGGRSGSGVWHSDWQAKYNTKYRPRPIQICWKVLFRKCTLADVKFYHPCSGNHCWNIWLTYFLFFDLFTIDAPAIYIKTFILNIPT